LRLPQGRERRAGTEITKNKQREAGQVAQAFRESSQALAVRDNQATKGHEAAQGFREGLQASAASNLQALKGREGAQAFREGLQALAAINLQALKGREGAQACREGGEAAAKFQTLESFEGPKAFWKSGHGRVTGGVVLQFQMLKGCEVDEALGRAAKPQISKTRVFRTWRHPNSAGPSAPGRRICSGVAGLEGGRSFLGVPSGHCSRRCQGGAGMEAAKALGEGNELLAVADVQALQGREVA